MSLLNDAASEMIAPLFPIFLTVTLGGAPASLGLVEGAADTASSLLKLVSGRLGDRKGWRVPLILVGYGLAALTRPGLASATSTTAVLGLRVTDRVGKGLRTSPRDALLAAGSPRDRLASVFGFHRAMDHLGAVVGALAAAALLEWSTLDLRQIFLWSVVPSVLGLGLILVAVRDPGVPADTSASKPGFHPPQGPLRWFLLAVGLFGLGHASDAFLLLKAGESGVPVAGLPLLWVALHVVKSLTSTSAGPLADRVGRRRIIAVGYLVAAAIYAGFAVAKTTDEFALLFVVYGLYHGLTEGSERAVAAQLAKHGTGESLGWYNLVSGVVALPAGLIFGALWTWVGAPAAFAFGATLAVLSLVPLWWSTRSVPAV